MSNGDIADIADFWGQGAPHGGALPNTDEQAVTAAPEQAGPVADTVPPVEAVQVNGTEPVDEVIAHGATDTPQIPEAEMQGMARSDVPEMEMQSGTNTPKQFEELTGGVSREAVVAHFDNMSPQEQQAFLEHLETHGSKLEAEDKAAGREVEDKTHEGKESPSAEVAGVSEEIGNEALAASEDKAPKSRVRVGGNHTAPVEGLGDHIARDIANNGLPEDQQRENDRLRAEMRQAARTMDDENPDKAAILDEMNRGGAKQDTDQIKNRAGVANKDEVLARQQEEARQKEEQEKAAAERKEQVGELAASTIALFGPILMLTQDYKHVGAKMPMDAQQDSTQEIRQAFLEQQNLLGLEHSGSSPGAVPLVAMPTPGMQKSQAMGKQA